MMVKRNRLTQSRQVAKGKEKLGVFATWRDSIISLTITENTKKQSEIFVFSGFFVAINSLPKSRKWRERQCSAI
ncbi:MAG: hypothetical protein R3A44_01440 [Caldilineaceae bacterium]